MSTLRVAGVGLFDGLGDAVRQGLDVDIEDGRFVAIGPSGERPPPTGADVIDGAGRVLMPGLIDCHAHYTIDAEDPEGIPRSATEPLPPAVLRAAGVVHRALAAGVTTARSAGAQGRLDVALRDAIAAGHIAGPRLLAATSGITPTGGHGHQFGIAADDASALLTAVRTCVHAGADVIKLMASEAAMVTDETRGLSTDDAGAAQYSEAEIATVVGDARRLGRRVMAHAQGSEAVIRAARAGVASVEHAFLADERAIDVLAETDTVLVPTLVVTDVWHRLEGLDDEARRRQDDVEVRHRRSCEAAVRAGVRLATGTDTGVPGVLPEMLPREVQLLHEHGATPAAALRAATSTAADLLGLAHEIGTIEVGKRADAVLLGGDPLEDLGRLERPEAVIAAGRVVAPSRP